jgi:hypothetical protein
MSPFIVSQQINPQTDPDLWSYNPHEGFIVSEVAVDMSGMYQCTAVYRRNGASFPSHETITYVVSVQRMLLNSLFIFFIYIYLSLYVCNHTLVIGLFHACCFSAF